MDRLAPVLVGFMAVASALLPQTTSAQGLTGALIGTVRDEQGASLVAVSVRLFSPALMGGIASATTNEKGQFRFPVLPPASYVIAIERDGFAPFHEEGIADSVGATIERTAVLRVAGVAESVVVEGSGSRIEARSSGFETRFSAEDFRSIPTRRFSMIDFVRAAPGLGIELNPDVVRAHLVPGETWWG